MVNTAILIIDMVWDFVDPSGALPVKDADELIPNINREIKNADVLIHVCDEHREDDKEFEIYPPHCIKGTKGALIVEGFKYFKLINFVHKKTRFSGFFNTDIKGYSKLEKILRQNNVDELLITGVCTEICVLATTLDALMRDYKVTLPKDCTKGLTDAGEMAALEFMELYGAVIQ